MRLVSEDLSKDHDSVSDTNRNFSTNKPGAYFAKTYERKKHEVRKNQFLDDVCIALVTSLSIYGNSRYGKTIELSQ